MAEEGKGVRVAIVVAVIGVVGSLGAALIANWDEVFGSDDTTVPTPAPDTTAFDATETTAFVPPDTTTRENIEYLIPPTPVTIRPTEWLDLDTGRVDATPGIDRPTFELVWICGAGDFEALRLENEAIDAGAAWAPFHVTTDLAEVSLADLQGGDYGADDHPETGYTDIFYEHKSNAPVVGSTYLVRTHRGNYGAVRISGYGPAELNICRDITLEYFSATP